MINRRTRSWLMFLMAALTWSATAIGATWAASGRETGMVIQIEANKQRGKDHEARLRTIEETLKETATDVKWLRNYWEKADD